MTHRRIVNLCGLLAIISLAGCSGGDGVVPVAGIVTLDGTPLIEATVAFDPVRGGSGTVYVATTDTSGEYALKDLDGSAGAPPGSYRISISTAKPLSPGPVNEDTKFSPERVPAKYLSGQLTFDVPPGGTESANFDLSSR